ncbi:MAG: winged helix-turn-helix domain-containing tetratricopeptide repeat protein [Pirellulaceae bacterium]
MTTTLEQGEPSIAFGPFRFDIKAQRLTRDGAPVSLGGRAVALLAALADARGEIVGRETIFSKVWPGVTVEDNNIQVQIATLRKVLGDGWISTVPGRGYRFVTGDAPIKSRDPVMRRPTLAVLPFVNLSGLADQDYLADALTEEITTALSRVRWFHVVARSSAFAYKGRQEVDVRTIGRELGAGYLLEGSVQRGGPRIRLTGSLVEAESGLRVWTDRFEGDLDDVFALQDRLSEAVVAVVEPSLRNAEISRTRARPTSSADAYDLYLRSLPLTWNGTRDNYDQAVDLLKRAVAMDEAFTVAKAFLTFTLMNRAGHGWSDSESNKLGGCMAREALDQHNDDPEVLRIAGHTLAFFARDFERSLASVERALTINPHGIGALMSAGWVRCYRVEPDEAIALFERALRLNPLSAELGYVLSGLGFAQLMAGNPQAAVPVLRRSIQERPHWAPAFQFLTAALHSLGRIAEAREIAAHLMTMVPRLRAVPEKWVLVAGPFRDDFMAALKAAGVPS